MNEQDVININPEESLYLAIASAYRLDLNGPQPTFSGTITLERERAIKAIERYRNQILDEAIEIIKAEADWDVMEDDYCDWVLSKLEALKQEVKE